MQALLVTVLASILARFFFVFFNVVMPIYSIRKKEMLSSRVVEDRLVFGGLQGLRFRAFGFKSWGHGGLVVG